MDETPVSLKKTKKTLKTNKRQCIIHFSSVASTNEVGNLTETTWQKIKQIDEQRKSKGQCYDELDEICENLPLEPDFMNHGFHRQCYMRFTNIKNLNSRKRKLCQEQEVENLSTKKRHPSGEKVLFSPDECIICGKGVKWYKIKGVSKRDKLIKCVTHSAEETLKQSMHQFRRTN